MILQQWGHGELDELKAANGFFNYGNAHLLMLINPKNTAFGFGYVHNPNAETDWSYVGATAIAEELSIPDYTPYVERDITVYRAARDDSEARKGIDYIEVLEGTEFTLEHSMKFWGGGGTQTQISPEVDKDTGYWFNVEGVRADGVAALPEKQVVLIKNRLSDQFEPVAQPMQTVREGKRLTITDYQLLAGLPAGTKVKIDGQSISNWVAPEVNADEIKTAKLTFTYQDGSIDETTLQVKVLNKLADKHQPTLQTNASGVERQNITLTYSGVSTGTKVEGNTFTAPAVASDETMQRTVTFTYEDDSVDKVTVPVLVKDSLADKHPVSAPAPAQVNENQTVSVQLPAAPAGTSISAEGATINGGTLTFNPGEMKGDRTYRIPVTYRYADGSRNTIEMQINATDTTPPDSSDSSSVGSSLGIIAAVFALIGIIFAAVNNMPR